jgi:RNA polymerase sigma-70 factor (ECF subfamily)
MRSYLYTTATNLTRDFWRRSGIGEVWKSDREDVDCTTGDWNSTPEKLDIEKTLGHLNNMERALILLAYREGYKHREIANIIGIKETSVKVLLFRARKKFIRKYGEINTVVERNG